MTADGARRRLLGRPWWLHLLVTAGILAILGGAVRATWPTWSLYPAIGPVVIGIGAVFWKDRRFWRLPRADRLAVEDAMRTGKGTGDSTLDQVARARLIRRARSFRSDRVLAPPLLLLAVALPVAAAVRSSDAWWLIGAVALCAQSILTEGAFPKDPRPALTSLTRGAA